MDGDDRGLPRTLDTLANRSPEHDLGDQPPVGRLYELDGVVLLLGVGHESNSALHLAEYRARWPGRRYIQEGAALRVNGIRRWVNFERLDLDASDFAAIGAAFEAEHPVHQRQMGQATTRLMKQRPLVNFAVEWMERSRGQPCAAP